MKKHDVWLRLLALILAFILWIIAREMTNPTRTTPVEDISLTITGEDELKSNYGLSVIEYPETVDITVRGPVNEISNSRLRNRRSWMFPALRTAQASTPCPCVFPPARPISRPTASACACWWTR